MANVLQKSRIDLLFFGIIFSVSLGAFSLYFYIQVATARDPLVSASHRPRSSPRRPPPPPPFLSRDPAPPSASLQLGHLLVEFSTVPDSLITLARASSR